MTSSDAPPADAGRLEGARRDYEALRGAVLDGGGSRELGFALLMRQGMAPGFVRGRPA